MQSATRGSNIHTSVQTGPYRSGGRRSDRRRDGKFRNLKLCALRHPGASKNFVLAVLRHGGPVSAITLFKQLTARFVSSPGDYPRTEKSGNLQKSLASRLMSARPSQLRFRFVLRDLTLCARSCMAGGGVPASPDTEDRSTQQNAPEAISTAHGIPGAATLLAIFAAVSQPSHSNSANPA